MHDTLLGQVVLCRDTQTQQLCVGKASRLGRKIRENPEDEVQMSLRFENSPYHPTLLWANKFTFMGSAWQVSFQEYCGRDLYTVIASSSGLGLEDNVARTIFYQVLSGMSLMHDQNVTHLDLKPENILVKEFKDGYRAWVCDLGQAQTNAYPSGLYGTVNYRAPEQAVDSVFNAQAADMYSLGMILFVMLTAQFFVESTPEGEAWLRQATQSQLEERLQLFTRQCNVDARSLIAGLLAPVPSDRLRLEQVFDHPWMQNL